MKEKNIWKYLFVVVICMILGIVGIVYIQHENLKKETKIIKTDNKYLTANYSMILYKKTKDYINVNVSSDDFNDKDTLVIKSSEVLSEVTDEYKYCSGEIIIKKVKYGIFEHEIKTSCENEATDNINLTMKVYTNINQNNGYQAMTDVRKTETGYTAILSNFIIDVGDDWVGSHYDGVGGVIYLDDELNIEEIKLLSEPKTGAAELYYLKDGYVIEEYPDGVNGGQVIAYYDSDFNLIWSMRNGGTYSFEKFLYETDNELVFYDMVDMVSLAKSDGNITNTKNINNDGSIINLEYRDGYLIGFDVSHYTLIKFNLNGERISTIDLLLQDGIKPTNFNIGFELGSNISLYDYDGMTYVFTMDGNLINKIDTREICNACSRKFNSGSDYYEIIYEDNGESYIVNDDGTKELVSGPHSKYVRYNLDNEIIISADIDDTYGYKTLSNMGLVLNNEKTCSEIIEDKLFEYIYAPDNNGTIILMLYDYSKVNDTNSVVKNNK